MEPASLISIYKFFGLWQFSVCLFSGTALIFIWKSIAQESQQKFDRGLLWLSLAIYVWALSGILDLMYSYQLSGNITALNDPIYQGTQSILSTLNSALILFALPYFKHIPPIVSPIIKSPTWKFLVSITFGFSSIVTLLMISGIVVPSKVRFVFSIDFIYAIFTLVFLGFILWESFAKRGLKNLSYLSALAIACTLIAQIFKLDDHEFLRIFFSCTFKTILIMLFFALALGWAKEVAKIIVPNSKEAFLVLFPMNKNRMSSGAQIILTLPPLLQTKKIKLTEKAFQLITTFSTKAMELDETEGWLEIKPKSDKLGNYDIKDYNEINRLMDQILKEIQAGSVPAEELKQQLKTGLFEYSNNRKVRLKIPSRNITISE